MDKGYPSMVKDKDMKKIISAIDRFDFISVRDLSTKNKLIQNGLKKSVLRDAVRSVVSKSIIDNPKKVGFTTLAFVGIYLEKAIDVNFAIKKLKAIEEITECHYTTGDWSILIKIYCKDNQHLMKLLNEKIQAIKGVSRTETFISLSQQISRQIRI